MRVALWLSGWLLLGSLFWGACSPALTSSDKTACSGRAIAECQKLDACVHNGVANRYGDEATCEERIKNNCDTSLTASHTGASSASVATCTAALPGASCGDYSANIISGCEPEEGSLATGKACTYDAQCSTAFCAIVTGTNCGTCAALSNPGDACVTTTCSPGLNCVTSTMTCQPPGAPAANCTTDEPCGYDLTCVTPTGATTGTCQSSGSSAGAACDTKHVTAAGCDGNMGLVCASATETCVLEAYAAPGEMCGAVSGTQVACTNASACFSASGTCIAFAKEGSACDTSVGPTCLSPARCVTGGPSSTSGTCMLPDPSACK